MFLLPYNVTQVLGIRTYLRGHYSADRDFPSGADRKESACRAGDLDLTPGLGRFPGKRNGNSLQYSDRGAWWATVHWVTKSRM